MHNKRYPNESKEYRKSRNELLQLEIELRDKIHEVATARKALADGGKLPEDYVFEEKSSDRDGETKTVKFSELFDSGKDCLLIYNFMYPPGGNACPMCTSFLDSFNGNAQYISQRVSLAVVAKATIDEVQKYADTRNWNNLRMLSSTNNTFNVDYFAEDSDGGQHGLINAFTKNENEIFHFWGPETYFVQNRPGNDARHVDQLWPLWNALDLTPEGRGTDWYPSSN